MPIGDNKANPPEVLAESIREIGHPKGRMRYDMRLVATPRRYKVQIWDYDKYILAGQRSGAIAWQQGTSWQDVQRMKRTSRTFVDWELDCAVRMFERRLREQMGEKTGLIWETIDKRKIPLRQMGTRHLLNCLRKCMEKQWRKQFIPTIVKELRTRGENPHGETN